MGELNGRYDLQKGILVEGRPVYAHVDRQDSAFGQGPLCMFFNHGYWVIAPEVRGIPRCIARQKAAAALEADDAAAHPVCANGRAPWEFLCGESNVGAMLTTDTRKYAGDRSVVVRAISSSESSVGESITNSQRVPISKPPTPATDVVSAAHRPRPGWVSEASVDIISDCEIKAIVTASKDVIVDRQGFSLDVAALCLRVSLSGQPGVLELTLPAAVDVDKGATARWSEKTRSLRVRLPRET